MSQPTPFAAEFAAFKQHKDTLINALRKSHGGGCKSFDEGNAWRVLARVAMWYLHRPEIKRKTVLPVRRRERLRELAKALNRAQKMAAKAMQDDVGLDLFTGWCAKGNI